MGEPNLSGNPKKQWNVSTAYHAMVSGVMHSQTYRMLAIAGFAFFLWFAMFHIRWLVLLCGWGIIAALKHVQKEKNLPFEIAPVIFFGALVTYAYGMLYSVVFIIVASLISVVFSQRFDPSTPIYPAIVVPILYLSTFLAPYGFVAAGLFISIAEFVGNTTFNLWAGADFEQIMPFTLIHLVLNMTLFLTLGRAVAPFI